MNSLQLFDVIGDIDDKMILAACASKRRKRIVRWASLAAAACFIVICAFMYSQFISGRPEFMVIGYKNTSYNSNTVPQNGTVEFDSSLISAKKKYADKNAKYLLRIVIFSDGSVLDESAAASEYDRLKKCGYRIEKTECWRYSDSNEKIYNAVTVGLFSKDELDSFKASSDYGYFFSFVRNGDGSVDIPDSFEDFRVIINSVDSN